MFVFVQAVVGLKDSMGPTLQIAMSGERAQPWLRSGMSTFDLLTLLEFL